MNVPESRIEVSGECGGSLGEVMSFETVWIDEDPWGRVAAVSLPGGTETVPERVLAQLDVEEARFAEAMRGFRPGQFVGGRLALRAAARALAIELPAVLSDDRGAPCLPETLRGSISHKKNLAVAILSEEPGWSIGLDYEELGPARSNISRLVLRDEELAQWEEAASWNDLLVVFSLKEALYKALDPYVRRYVGFREVAIWRAANGAAEVELFLEGDEGPFEVEARYRLQEDSVISLVRVRRAG